MNLSTLPRGDPLRIAIDAIRGDAKRDEVVDVLVREHGVNEASAHAICSRAQRGYLGLGMTDLPPIWLAYPRGPESLADGQ